MAESAPGAAADWALAAAGASTQDFFDAASRGRRWRGAPTATLSTLAAQGSPHAQAYADALAQVASAACELGEPTMRVIGNASVAAAAQLSVLPPRAVPGTPPAAGVGPSEHSAPAPEDHVTVSTGRVPDQAEPAPPAHQQPQKNIDELLAELDALIGLQRVKREIHRQVAVLRVEKLRATPV